MIERHYDDEALITLLESDRAGNDAHLPSCRRCSDKVDSFRTIAGALRDRDVWDQRDVRTEPVASTIATLRAFADRMTDEDTRAEQFLAELLAGPRESWMPRLDEHPEWRTPGVVRKLIAAAPRAIDTMPPDAVQMATLATEIAEHLDASSYPSDTIPRLRGAAWRERAYALYYTGNFAEAEVAVSVAERNFAACAINDYELGRLHIVRSLVLQMFERFDDAMDAASHSAETFNRFEDVNRTASARLAEVHLLLTRGDYKQAETLLFDLDAYLTGTPYVETHARVLANLGFCVARLGDIASSVQYYDLAAALYEDLGIATEAVRCRWGVTGMLAEAGHFAAAWDRLAPLTKELERLGMTSEAACNGLYVAELLLAVGRYDQVEQLCRESMRIFERSGVGYTSHALTALAYIHEAAAHRTASPKLVRTVRDYIRKLPSQPSLLFAPPPLES